MIGSPGSDKIKATARQQLAESIAKVEKLRNEAENSITIHVTDVSLVFIFIFIILILIFLFLFPFFSSFFFLFS
jgi:hypothetical protein